MLVAKAALKSCLPHFRRRANASQVAQIPENGNDPYSIDQSQVRSFGKSINLTLKNSSSVMNRSDHVFSNQ